MTALIALAGADGVFMAADSRRTSVVSGIALPSVSKLKSLPGSTLWAKGGWGSQADDLFPMLLADPRGKSGDLDRVAEATYELGKDVYARCKQIAEREKVDDLGLYILMAGFDADGAPKIRSIHFGLDENKAGSSGEYFVLATDTDRARELISGKEASYINNERRFAADIYGLDAMKTIVTAMPSHVGFPIEVAVAKRNVPLAHKIMNLGSIVHDPALSLQL